MGKRPDSVVLEGITTFGAFVLKTTQSTGRFVLFLIRAARTLVGTPLNMPRLLEQLVRIGVDSFNIVVLTGSFAGLVFALQSYIGFQRVGGEQFIGAIVALGMIRELGPVLTGLMVTGRAGSAIAAELGTMRITEQIDALRTLRINTYAYLVVPRLLASIIMLPLLTLFAMLCGIISGYLLCTNILGLSGEDYISNIKTYVEMQDITGGLIKAATFGFLLAWVGSYKGFYTYGGARGVGRATTESVVMGSILILIFNYFLTKMLEQL